MNPPQVLLHCRPNDVQAAAETGRILARLARTLRRIIFGDTCPPVLRARTMKRAAKEPVALEIQAILALVAHRTVEQESEDGNIDLTPISSARLLAE